MCCLHFECYSKSNFGDRFKLILGLCFKQVAKAYFNYNAPLVLQGTFHLREFAFQITSQIPCPNHILIDISSVIATAISHYRYNCTSNCIDYASQFPFQPSQSRSTIPMPSRTAKCISMVFQIAHK